VSDASPAVRGEGVPRLLSHAHFCCGSVPAARRYLGARVGSLPPPPGRRRGTKRTSVKVGGGTPAPLVLQSSLAVAKS